MTLKQINTSPSPLSLVSISQPFFPPAATIFLLYYLSCHLNSRNFCPLVIKFCIPTRANLVFHGLSLSPQSSQWSSIDFSLLNSIAKGALFLVRAIIYEEDEIFRPMMSENGSCFRPMMNENGSLFRLSWTECSFGTCVANSKYLLGTWWAEWLSLMIEDVCDKFLEKQYKKECYIFWGCFRQKKGWAISPPLDIVYWLSKTKKYNY